MRFVIIPNKISLKGKNIFFTFTPQPGGHATLAVHFVWRGFHAVEFAAGEKVRGNIFCNVEVCHKNDVCHYFCPILLLYSCIKSVHCRFLCRQCKLKALAAIFI